MRSSAARIGALSSRPPSTTQRGDVICATASIPAARSSDTSHGSNATGNEALARAATASLSAL